MTDTAPSTMKAAENYVLVMLNKTKNNRNLALTIFTKLFEELPAQLTGIDDALQKQQLIQAKDISHILHGSASFCGLSAIQNPAKNLEISLINADIEAAKQHFLELQKHVASLVDQQKTILAILNNQL